jgi:cytochrome P450
MTPGQTRRQPDWDPLEDAALQDPTAAHAELRQRCPVAFSGRWGGFWSLMRHEDIVAAALDTDTFISGEKTTIPDSTGPGRPPRPPLEVDRPEHTHYRRLLAPYFTPQRIAEWEPTIRTIAADLIAPAVADGETEMVAAVALPMPALVLCAFLDLPSEDWTRLKEWTSEVIDAGRTGDAERHAAANDALYGYVRTIVQARREARLDPERDMITGLLELEIAGRRLDDDEVTSVVRLMLQAGHNTTTNGLGSAFRYLGGQLDEQNRLRRDASLIPAAVDELLRVFSPAQFLARTVTRNVELHDRVLRAGEKVCLFWSSANRDAQAFADADTVELGRSPNRHIAFGYGIHRCLGAHLARVEMRVALEEILARTSKFELVGPAPEIGWPHIGPSIVPMRLSPRTPPETL